MTGDAALLAAVARAAGSAARGSRPVAGGDVNRALRVDLADGRHLFVKHRAGAPPGAFRAEADDLAWLAAAGALATPRVVAVGEGPEPFLALEWVERGTRGPGHDEALGRGLAALHAAGAPCFGLDRDNWIATLPQENSPLPTFPAFLLERRLAPLVRRLVDRRVLDARDAAALDRLAGRLPDLTGPPEPPARLHGDLWAGNAICDTAGMPVLVDPAAYGGHRETDLAMMRLFGGFGPAVFAAYEEASPLAPGHEDRVALHQLWPLLVHAALFGGGYATRASSVLARYAG